ncbi:hypothetical protein AAG570_013475 [Ranatra chinensis]|uniref:rRNA adenine N(6)-methyltransferase n=1 Tax=Ranatra chinensis TaxID=642074 RepID=A0ABD0YC99_9HEMI
MNFAKSGVRLPPLPSIGDLLRLYRLRALKRLSQNFLLDSRVCDKIVKVAGPLEGGHVCEVGPGPGSITRSIIRKSPAKLLLVEKDPRFTPTLEMLQEASPFPVQLVQGDIMNFDMADVFDKDHVRPWSDRPPNVHLIGNLPFSVATPLIIRWIYAISERTSAWKYGRVKMTLTFQAEVAERVVSPIMTRSRCRLSVMCQNWCHVEYRFTIPGSVFVPKPDVDVGVVHFVPRLVPIIDLPFKIVEKVVRSLFCYRQKYILKSVGTLFPVALREKLALRCLEEAEVPTTARSFQLTLPEIGRICYAYTSILRDYPKLETYNHRLRSDVTLEDDPLIEREPPESEDDLYDTSSRAL